ncbi:hypothetical protein AX15_006791 [Amanita polypyramis BW_CC]|nr:hypothetical protein AX15_006791 [Amanita polypyramis BW_CC]
MPAADRPSKNSLSLRLTESAVFLRTRPGRRSDEASQPSVLRGLLVLDLVKPTRISSIELELKAKSSTAWPEGFGARRIEVTEEHTVFHVSVVYFKAGQATERRPTSVGPGISIRDGYEDWDDYPHTPPSPGVSPSPARQRRWGSIDGYFRRPHAEHYDEYNNNGAPPYSLLPPTPGMTSLATSPSSSVAHLPLTPANERSSTPCSDGHPRRNLLPSLPELTDRLIHEQFRDGQNDPRDENDNHTDSATRSFWRSITPHRNRDTSHDRQGRSHSRFSLASMSYALLDVMRPRQGHSLDESQARGRTLEKGHAPIRDQASETRGRPLQKGQMVVRNQVPGERYVGSEDRTTLGVLGDILKHDHQEQYKENVNWKEFKKGTYTYPISISIPGHCPPTLHCDYGGVTWRLKAVVHRPGAFKSKLMAIREVITVACPIEDDTENTENIIVERHWDQQLQYLISVSGRSFYIGGTMPVSFTLMPLAKVKVHKIYVCIEERVDYYTRMKRISRTEPISRVVLLSVKSETKGDDPILPLESDDVDAFRNSPLYNLATSEDDISEMASNLMGPGPWTFHQDLHLPHSCQHMHFTNMNKRSNITITHILKWIIRVERGDDLHINPKTGKRKLFDIVVQTPVHILSVSRRFFVLGLTTTQNSSVDAILNGQHFRVIPSSCLTQAPSCRLVLVILSVRNIHSNPISAIFPHSNVPHPSSHQIRVHLAWKRVQSTLQR